VQVLQRFVLGIPHGNPIVGQAVDMEPLHFLYNLVLLASLGVLWWAADLRHLRGRDWGTVAFLLIAFATLAQSWHMVEHVVKLLQYLATGKNDTPGILGAAFNLPLLHLAYNILVYVPLLAAFVAVGIPRALLRAREAVTAGR
jgi:hypothetical protein